MIAYDYGFYGFVLDQSMLLRSWLAYDFSLLLELFLPSVVIFFFRPFNRLIYSFSLDDSSNFVHSNSRSNLSRDLNSCCFVSIGPHLNISRCYRCLHVNDSSKASRTRLHKTKVSKEMFLIFKSQPSIKRKTCKP